MSNKILTSEEFMDSFHHDTNDDLYGEDMVDDLKIAIKK